MKHITPLLPMPIQPPPPAKGASVGNESDMPQCKPPKNQRMNHLNPIINELTGLAHRIASGEIPQTTSLTTGSSQNILECVEKLKHLNMIYTTTPINCSLVKKEPWRKGPVNLNDNMFRVTLDLTKNEWYRLMEHLDIGENND